MNSKLGQGDIAGAEEASRKAKMFCMLSAGLGLAEAGTVADVASCPGAETCRLAVTQSRGLGRLLEDHLRARPDLMSYSDPGLQAQRDAHLGRARV